MPYCDSDGIRVYYEVEGSGPDLIMIHGFAADLQISWRLPGVADATKQIDWLIDFAVRCAAEEIFIEPVNPRGPGLRLCQEALEEAGHEEEAAAIEKIRKRKHWSRYTAQLVTNVQQSVRARCDISKLRFLLYPSRLLPKDKARIRKDDAGVVWLEKR